LPAAGIGLLQTNFEELLCNAITDPGGCRLLGYLVNGVPHNATAMTRWAPANLSALAALFKVAPVVTTSSTTTTVPFTTFRMPNAPSKFE
jgi:hypothetical protein